MYAIHRASGEVMRVSTSTYDAKKHIGAFSTLLTALAFKSTIRDIERKREGKCTWEK